MSIRRAITVVVAFVAVASAPWTARGIELITNGGFETGDFTGWTVTDQAGSFGTFFIDDADGFTPFSSHPTVGPAAGLLYAVADQNGPGTHVLTQSFTVPAAASSVTLSFNMFVNDWSDVGPSDQGLDYTLFPNQHARVDIMSAAAGPFDTGAGVLANVYLGVDAGPDPHAYTPYVIDITTAVAGGGTFVVRFAEAQNQFYQNLGVDNVSIDATLCNADGVIDVGEECDDGNSMNGDGCSQGCRIEPCHTCAGAPSLCSAVPDGTSCDDRMFCNGADTCLTATCTVHAGDPCAGGIECNNVCNEGADSCTVPAATPCTDDGNVCTGDVCNGAGVCAHPPADGRPVTTACSATAMTSVLGEAAAFSFGDPCFFGSECNTICDEVGDMCGPNPDGDAVLRRRHHLHQRRVRRCGHLRASAGVQRPAVPGRWQRVHASISATAPACVGIRRSAAARRVVTTAMTARTTNVTGRRPACIWRCRTAPPATTSTPVRRRTSARGASASGRTRSSVRAPMLQGGGHLRSVLGHLHDLSRPATRRGTAAARRRMRSMRVYWTISPPLCDRGESVPPTAAERPSDSTGPTRETPVSAR